jgi:hypothetical protein
MTQEVKSTLIRIEKTTLFLTIVFLFLSILLGRYFFAYGITIGAILGIINFRLLAKSIISFASREKKNPFTYFLFAYSTRFLFLAIVFSVCLMKDIKLFLGAATGFLFIQISIFLNNFWLYRE